MKTIALSLALLLSGPAPAQEPQDMLRRGISLINASRPAEAEQALRALLQRYPDHVFARSLLGLVLLQRAGLDEAEAAFDAVLAAEPGNGTARFGLGLVLARKGKPRAAAREFAQALPDEAVGRKARLHWIESLFLAGDDAEALREARDASERFPMAPEFQGLLGMLQQARGDAPGALRAYRRAVELEPRNPRYYLNVVEIFRIQKDHAGALRWADLGLAADRDHPLLHEEKAAALDRLGKPEEAEAERQEASRTRAAEIAYGRAMRALAAGDAAGARRLLNESTALNPMLSKAWTESAGILQREGALDEARRAYLMAIETDPENGTAQLGLALTLRAQGKASESLAALQRAVDRGIADPDVLAGIAAAYVEQGRAREAAAVMLRAVRELPDDPDLLSFLGYVQASGGNERAAQEAYAAAVRIDPAQPDALLATARYMLARGRTADAVAVLAGLSASHPRRLEVWHSLIEAYGRAGDARAAEQACRSCLARFGADRDCREQLAYIKMAAGDFRSAAQQLEMLDKDGTGNKSTLDGLAFSLMKRGNYTRAIRLFEGSLQRFGQDGWVYANLGFLHRCRGETGAAVANYRRARDLSPDDAARQHDLGFALYLARDYALAAEPLRSAVRLKPDWGAAHYDLAMNYWRMKLYGLALTHARIALQQNVPGAARTVDALSAQLAPARRTAARAARR